VVLAGAILAAFYLSACRKSKAPEHAAKTKTLDAPAVATTLQTAMDRAGGFGIWIKKPAACSTTMQGGTAGEVLAVPSAFGSLLNTIQRCAEKEGLQARITESTSRERWRLVKLEILSGNQPVCGWRLREVSQIRRAAIIIDDLGQDLSAERQLLDLRYPLSFSVMPNLAHSTQIAEEAHRAGREVLLHLPMQPEPGAAVKPSPDELRVGMTGWVVRRTIEADLVSVPHAAGVNNHMGSRATADAKLMEEVMQVLSERHLYFVDSRTTPDSVALERARQMRVPAFYRSVFLDDTETTAYTLGQLNEMCRLVKEQGMAIAIGHPHPTTLAALAQFLPELEKDDIQLLPAYQIVRLPEAARLWPAHKKAIQARITY
jgi:polysaccharide deacetylase 2 family uncharacterized protein YibQ